MLASVIQSVSASQHPTKHEVVSKSSLNAEKMQYDTRRRCTHKLPSQCPEHSTRRFLLIAQLQ
jgi:hypothetical protein